MDSLSVHASLTRSFRPFVFLFFFFTDTPTTEIYTLSLHDALPILRPMTVRFFSGSTMPLRAEKNSSAAWTIRCRTNSSPRSEEHTSELQSRGHLVCRLLLEKKKKTNKYSRIRPTLPICYTVVSYTI